MIFDPLYFLLIAPGFLLALLAQGWIKIAYASAKAQPAPLSGAAAARHILDSAGLQNIPIETTPGELSDHYDPSAKVIRLSPDVYNGRTLAAVGIAAHEVGHAIQHARHYTPLVLRNFAVPMASFGSNFAFIFIMVGVIIQSLSFLAVFGVVLFGGVVVFQLVNLPVEFNASSRAKEQLATLGIVTPQQMGYVRSVLSAAAMTYVAATLVAVLQLIYFIIRVMAVRD